MFEEERIAEIIKQVKKLAYSQEIKLDGFFMAKVGGETKPNPQIEAVLSWKCTENGNLWGGHNEYFVFRGSITIPKEMAGKKVLFSLLTGKEGEWDATNPQFTVYVDGKLRQGFDVNHHAILLSENALENETHTVFLSSFTGIQNYSLQFLPSLMVEDPDILDYYYNLRVPYDTAMILEPSDENYRKIMPNLQKAVIMLDLRRPYSKEFYESIKKSNEFLKDCFYKENPENAPFVDCVGHTHIDVAWLWTTRVTRDKAVRSFSTALELMKKYPEYIFMSSQPQLYQYVKEDAPEIFEEIKKKVKDGRWEAEGGMFLEPDCNLPSGESLIRQFFVGKKFFQNEFDYNSRILWLPDVFGYSAALPQIMKKCGIDYFMTTKISWNEINKMPYDTFYWRGIDGTKILSYFITTRDYVSSTRDTKTSNEFCTDISTNYNGYINPSEIMGAWQRYQQKNLSEHVLCSYGYGDGGGGPTEEMLEVEKRLSHGLPGCPITKNSKAIDFFDHLKEDTKNKNVPIWSGELYLEYHRGTYTSMAENKKNNRKAEFALTNAESLGVLAENLGETYPWKIMDNCWEKVLRNQFHDILPGSAVKEVYEDSRKEYGEVFCDLKKASQKFLETIEENLSGNYIYNPNGVSVTGILETENPKGKDLSNQTSADGKYLIYSGQVPLKGMKKIEDCKENFCSVFISENEIKSPYADIKFNAKGQIVSWMDLENNRELLKPGSKANVLRAYDDRPHKYDNWNIFDYYKEIYWDIDCLISSKVTENGPVRYALEFSWKYLDSIISETICVYPFTQRVDFKFHTDWNESQTLLKALFPVEMNTDEATFDIQYGNVVRKTHENTSWDTARFESCMHKWIDLSEGGFGVSFLNDCKYGVSVSENEVGISLIKCGNYPNPDADRGIHEAVYSVYPHEGTWKEAETVNEAYALNNPLIPVFGKAKEQKMEEMKNFLTSDAENVSFDVLKPSEDGKGYIVRYYEYKNRRSTFQLNLFQKAKQIWKTDMLENSRDLLKENSDSISLEILPYAIDTIKIIF